MQNFRLLANDCDFSEVIAELEAQPELWQVNTFRQDFEESPFKTCESIVCRMSYDAQPDDDYREIVNQNAIQSLQAFDTPEYHRLPAVYGQVMALMAAIRGEQLGRVLVAKMLPDGHIDPHPDGDGTGYFAYYRRFHLVISGKGCRFRAGEEYVYMMPGEIWWFDNSKVHEVWNESDADRIHIIADIKTRSAYESATESTD